MKDEGNLVDLKDIMFLLNQYLNRATEKERLYFALEVSRMKYNFDVSRPTEEPTVPKPKKKVKMV